jgi:transcriptional regulator with XRE-family HTH domain
MSKTNWEEDAPVDLRAIQGKVKSWLNQDRVNIAAVARETGVSESTLRKFARGERPKHRLSARILEALTLARINGVGKRKGNPPGPARGTRVKP